MLILSQDKDALVNFNSIKNVKSIIGMYPSIKINLVPDKYYIGYDKFLCDYLNSFFTSNLLSIIPDSYIKSAVFCQPSISASVISVEKS